MKKLLKEYKKRRSQIKKRLKDFKAVWSMPDEKIFSELCFCICTPQSKAIYCDQAIKNLEKNNILYKGSLRQVRSHLHKVRFPNNKSKYILEARKFFSQKGRIRIKDKLDTGKIKNTRHWLVRNVKGLGLKEASHFLRNIGFGRELAILDVHILKNMKKYGIIKEVPKNISEKKYLILEEKIEKFSGKINIPMDELDLLFWASETGVVFK